MHLSILILTTSLWDFIPILRAGKQGHTEVEQPSHTTGKCTAEIQTWQLVSEARAQKRSAVSCKWSLPWAWLVVHIREGSSPWGVRTLSSVSAQADDRICPLETGCVPGTSLDLQRERGVTDKHTRIRITTTCLNPDLPTWQLCDLEQVS